MCTDLFNVGSQACLSIQQRAHWGENGWFFKSQCEHAQKSSSSNSESDSLSPSYSSPPSAPGSSSELVTFSYREQ